MKLPTVIRDAFAPFDEERARADVDNAIAKHQATQHARGCDCLLCKAESAFIAQEGESLKRDAIENRRRAHIERRRACRELLLSVVYRAVIFAAAVCVIVRGLP